MSSGDQRERGKLFNEVPELYERVRPSYPDELFADLVAVTSVDATSSALEIGCGTGQATRPLAQLGCNVARTRGRHGRHRSAANDPFVEPHHRSRHVRSLGRTGPTIRSDRRRIVLALDRPEHRLGTSTLLPSSVRPARLARPRRHPPNRRARDLRRDRRHPRALRPRQSGLGHPPLEDEVRVTSRGWGPPNEDRGGLFGPTLVRWYPTEQHFDGVGFADLLRTLSPYRCLGASVREPLLDAIAQRIRTDLNDHATRRYLTVLRAGQRAH